MLIQKEATVNPTSSQHRIRSDVEFEVDSWTRGTGCSGDRTSDPTADRMRGPTRDYGKKNTGKDLLEKRLYIRLGCLLAGTEIH